MDNCLITVLRTPVSDKSMERISSISIHFKAGEANNTAASTLYFGRGMAGKIAQYYSADDILLAEKTIDANGMIPRLESPQNVTGEGYLVIPDVYDCSEFSIPRFTDSDVDLNRLAKAQLTGAVALYNITDGELSLVKNASTVILDNSTGQGPRALNGDLSVMEGNTIITQFFIAKTNVTGSLLSFATCTALTEIRIYDSPKLSVIAIESLLNAMFSAGRTSGTLRVVSSNDIATYDGQFFYDARFTFSTNGWTKN